MDDTNKVKNLGQVAAIVWLPQPPKSKYVIWFDTTEKIRKVYNFDTQLWEPLESGGVIIGGENIGVGEGFVYKETNLLTKNLVFRTLRAGQGLKIVTDDNEITIALKAYLRLNPYSLVFTYEAGQVQTFTIEANTNWVILPKTGDFPNWFSLSTQSGSGDATIVVKTLTANTTSENRSFSIIVRDTSGEVNDRELLIYQTATVIENSITINPPNFLISRDANIVYFDVIVTGTDTDYVISSVSDSVNFVVVKESASRLKVICYENATQSNRTCTIVLSNSSLTANATCEVVQGFVQNSITVTPPSMEIPAVATTANFTVEVLGVSDDYTIQSVSNSNFTATKISKTQLRVVAVENVNTSSRTCIVVLQHASGSPSTSVTIVQAAAAPVIQDSISVNPSSTSISYSAQTLMFAVSVQGSTDDYEIQSVSNSQFTATKISKTQLRVEVTQNGSTARQATIRLRNITQTVSTDIVINQAAYLPTITYTVYSPWNGAQVLMDGVNRGVITDGVFVYQTTVNKNMPVTVQNGPSETWTTGGNRGTIRINDNADGDSSAPGYTPTNRIFGGIPANPGGTFFTYAVSAFNFRTRRNYYRIAESGTIAPNSSVTLSNQNYDTELYDPSPLQFGQSTDLLNNNSWVIGGSFDYPKAGVTIFRFSASVNTTGSQRWTNTVNFPIISGDTTGLQGLPGSVRQNAS